MHFPTISINIFVRYNYTVRAATPLHVEGWIFCIYGEKW